MTKAERKRMDRIACMGCAACWSLHGPHVPGPVELHHYRGGGWGKGGVETLIPLCYEHHRGQFSVHGMGTKGFDAHYGDAEIYAERAFTQASLLSKTIETYDMEYA